MWLNKFDGCFWQEKSAEDFAGRGESRMKVASLTAMNYLLRRRLTSLAV
jgi:hypothetical protein